MQEISLPFKYKTHPIRMVFYAVFFSILLFLVLPLSHLFQTMVNDKIIVRPIDIIASPPKPPEKKEQEESVSEQEQLNIEMVSAEVEIEPFDVMLDANLSGDLKVKMDVASFKVNGLADSVDLLADIKMFTLVELDAIPRSLNDPLPWIPKELIAKGIGEINAEALVVLNEKGEVEFESFLFLSHQEANKVVKKYIQKLKYTAPQKDGEVGRVRFRLPIKLRAE